MKTTKLNEKIIMKTLNIAYDKAVNGIPGLDSAQELAESYMKNSSDMVKNCNSLIRWQISKAGTSGFLTGLGGILTMPVTIPANITSVIYIQIRMIAAIAHMGGYDLHDDRVKSLVYLSMAGNSGQNILKEVGIRAGRKMATQLIKNISGKTIIAINKKVGFRLLTKFGEKGVINLGKTVPIVGGVVGSVFDSVATNTIGNIARNTFIESK